MKKLSLLIILLVFAACGGRKITHNYARSLITSEPQAALQESDIEVVSIAQTSGTEAIVETRLQTAFRLEKQGRDWTVREVRLGHDGQWEKMETLEQALIRVKTEDTQSLLGKIAEAIRLYKKDHGKAPVFNDYVSLSDILNPEYMTPLIRLDAWRRPFEARLAGGDSILLLSAGPDGKIGTQDDIQHTVAP